MAKRNNPMAPYYVQMREYERRLIKEALEHVAPEGPISGKRRVCLAAGLLGVTPKYVRVRAQILGGVLPGEPKHEPPGLAAKIWQGSKIKTEPSG